MEWAAYCQSWRQNRAATHSILRTTALFRCPMCQNACSLATRPSAIASAPICRLSTSIASSRSSPSVAAWSTGDLAGVRTRIFPSLRRRASLCLSEAAASLTWRSSAESRDTMSSTRNWSGRGRRHCATRPACPPLAALKISRTLGAQVVSAVAAAKTAKGVVAARSSRGPDPRKCARAGAAAAKRWVGRARSAAATATRGGA